MRGRLVHAFLAEIARLDRAATAAPLTGTLPSRSGYDVDFQEPVVLADGAGASRDARRELPALRVPCQVEVQDFAQLTELGTGNSPHSRLVLVFHFADLEQLALVDAATGEPRIGVADRLVAIRAARSGELVQAIRIPPGLYLTEAQPDFGLGGRRNLLITSWTERALGTRGGAG